MFGGTWSPFTQSTPAPIGAEQEPDYPEDYNASRTNSIRTQVESRGVQSAGLQTFSQQGMVMLLFGQGQRQLMFWGRQNTCQYRSGSGGIS